MSNPELSSSESSSSSNEKDTTQKPPRLGIAGENDGPGESSKRADVSSHANAESENKTRKRSVVKTVKSQLSKLSGTCKISPVRSSRADSSNPSEHHNRGSSLEGGNNEPPLEGDNNEPPLEGDNNEPPLEEDNNEPPLEEDNVPPLEGDNEPRPDPIAQSNPIVPLDLKDPNVFFRLLLWIAGYDFKKYKWNETQTNRRFSLQLFLDGLTTWWLLFTIFCVSIVFTGVQPMWDSYRSEFVPGEYHNLTSGAIMCNHFTNLEPACLTPNETLFLNDTDTHINRFVQTLHSIITQDGCQNLDRRNIAADFVDDRPLIVDDIVFDDLIRTLNYTADDARLLIKTCRAVFENKNHDVVTVHDHGFIYLNDYLMKHCGFKTDYFSDMCTFLILFLVFYSIYVPIRKHFNNKMDDLFTWYYLNWIQDPDTDSPSITPVLS